MKKEENRDNKTINLDSDYIHVRDSVTLAACIFLQYIGMWSRKQ